MSEDVRGSANPDKGTHNETEAPGATGLTILHDDALPETSTQSKRFQQKQMTDVDDIAEGREGLLDR